VTSPDDIEQGEVLWIGRDVCYLPELPDGFALRVDRFLGRDYNRPRWVWVIGSVLLNARGRVLRNLKVCAPVDQPRAVTAHGGRSPQVEPSAPPRTVGTARVEGGRHRGDRGQHPDRGMLGPPPGYTRTTFG
jgi:hypothetical protein